MHVPAAAAINVVVMIKLRMGKFVAHKAEALGHLNALALILMGIGI